jgi:hypothetical protein
VQRPQKAKHLGPLEHATRDGAIRRMRTNERTATDGTSVRQRRGPSRGTRRRRASVEGVLGLSSQGGVSSRRRVGSPSHDVSGFDDERCSTDFEQGLDRTSRPVPRLEAVDPRKSAAVVERRSSRRVRLAVQAPSAVAKRRLESGAVESDVGCSMGDHAALEPGVRQRPAFRCSPQGERWLCRAPARQKGSGEDDVLDGLVPTIEVAAEVERRRRSRNVQRRGKPEHCIDRIAEEGETSGAKRRRASSRGGKIAESRSLAECADSQEKARRARRCETWCTEPYEPLPGWRKPVSNRAGPGEAPGASSRSSSGG